MLCEIKPEYSGNFRFMVVATCLDYVWPLIFLPIKKNIVPTLNSIFRANNSHRLLEGGWLDEADAET